MARRRHLSRAERARLAASLAPGPETPSGPLPRRARVRPASGALQLVGRPAEVELLSTMTFKQRRYVIRLLETGNARRSVLDAGYRCKNLRTADDIARELMSNPRVQHAFQGIVEARGLGTAKLDQILALHASRHSSRNGGDRDRSLRATIATYKYVLPKPPADAKSVPADIIDEMTPEEQRRFAEHRIWPERFRSRLRAAGFAPSSDQAPSGTGSSGAFTPSGSGAAPDARPNGDVSGASFDDPAGDAERATSATMPAAPPSPEPSAMRAPSEPTRLAEPLEPQAPHAWQRPEDRVFAPPRPALEPPATQPSSIPQPTASALDATDPIAEAKRARVLHTLTMRDCRW